MKSAMEASKSPSANLTMKMKELKKEVKKLEKENSKLLDSLQKAQSGSGGQASNGGETSDERRALLEKVEKLNRSLQTSHSRARKSLLLVQKKLKSVVKGRRKIENVMKVASEYLEPANLQLFWPEPRVG